MPLEKNDENLKKSSYIASYLKKKRTRYASDINQNGNPVFGALGTASTMGLHMVSGPIVGTGLGYLFDSYVFDSFPYGSIIGFILGIFAGFRNVQIDAQRLEKSQSEMDAHAKNTDMSKNDNTTK